jgi:hypothetical protein
MSSDAFLLDCFLTVTHDSRLVTTGTGGNLFMSSFQCSTPGANVDMFFNLSFAFRILYEPQSRLSVDLLVELNMICLFALNLSNSALAFVIVLEFH